MPILRFILFMVFGEVALNFDKERLLASLSVADSGCLFGW